MKKDENKQLLSIVESSQNSLEVINHIFGAQLPEDSILKHFALWVIITKKSSKEKIAEIECNHRCHSNFPPGSVESVKILCRFLLIHMIRKIGIPAVEEILTDLRIGGIDDEEDNIN